MSAYPEHEKLKAIAPQSQVCGEFIEWLKEQGYSISTHDEGKPFFNLKRMLAEFFEIDENKLEDEKVAMLEEQRRLNKP